MEGNRLPTPAGSVQTPVMGDSTNGRHGGNQRTPNSGTQDIVPKEEEREKMP